MDLGTGNVSEIMPEPKCYITRLTLGFMKEKLLTGTGVSVSELCLGCLPFGFASSSRRSWTLNEEESKKILDRAIELGVNFFDTANSYSWGDSERVLGSVLSEYNRDKFVVATKVRLPPMEDPHPNATGLSRKTIEQELANSLERLQMDTIDLYQIHRWDYNTPIKETLQALDDSIRRGQVRYIGASSMFAYQFASALHTSHTHGLDRFVTMQNHYNLVYREPERELLPLCRREDIGIIPYSPLARGYLARPSEEFGTTSRGQDEVNNEGRFGVYREGNPQEINQRVREIATEKDVSMAQVALAWLFHKKWVDTPIIGVTSVDHLEEAVQATEISLTKSDIEYLEALYEPVSVSGPNVEAQ